MRLPLCIFFLFFFTFSRGQNLVVNPGFELGDKREHQEILDDNFSSGKIRNMKIPGWSDPTGTSDLYYVDPNAPRKPYSSMTPVSDSGWAFAGFWGSVNGCDVSEYIQGTLTEPLQAGKTYRFFSSITYTNGTGETIYSVGIRFSSKLEMEPGEKTPYLELKPQCKLDTSRLKREKRWPVYYTDYTATGDEKYFIMGTFHGKCYGQDERTYLYVDNICLTPLSRDDPQNARASISDFMKPGKALALSSVSFAKNSDSLLSESFPSLYNIIIALNNNPALEIEIVFENSKAGKNLCEKRAAAIRDFISEFGIMEKRISYSGKNDVKKTSQTDLQPAEQIRFIFSG
jgi:hypothetical protein